MLVNKIINKSYCLQFYSYLFLHLILHHHITVFIRRLLDIGLSLEKEVYANYNTVAGRVETTCVSSSYSSCSAIVLRNPLSQFLRHLITDKISLQLILMRENGFLFN